MAKLDLNIGTQIFCKDKHFGKPAKLVTDEFAYLPHVQPRGESEILEELHNRLHRPWPPVFSGVRVSFKGGVLRLFGHVHSEILRCHVQELARIDGVIDIQNDLIVDAEIGVKNVVSSPK